MTLVEVLPVWCIDRNPRGRDSQQEYRDPLAVLSSRSRTFFSLVQRYVSRALWSHNPHRVDSQPVSSTKRPVPLSCVYALVVPL